MEHTLLVKKRQQTILKKRDTLKYNLKDSKIERISKDFFELSFKKRRINQLKIKNPDICCDDDQPQDKPED